MIFVYFIIHWATTEVYVASLTSECHSYEYVRTVDIFLLFAMIFTSKFIQKGGLSVYLHNTEYLLVEPRLTKEVESVWAKSKKKKQV